VKQGNGDTRTGCTRGSSNEPPYCLDRPTVRWEWVVHGWMDPSDHHPCAWLAGRYQLTVLLQHRVRNPPLVCAPPPCRCSLVLYLGPLEGYYYHKAPLAMALYATWTRKKVVVWMQTLCESPHNARMAPTRYMVQWYDTIVGDAP
jgi:hypothetical protein